MWTKPVRLSGLLVCVGISLLRPASSDAQTARETGLIRALPNTTVQVMARADGMVEIRASDHLSYVVVAVDPSGLRGWIDSAGKVMAVRPRSSPTLETRLDTPFLADDPYADHSKYMWLVRTVGGRNPGTLLIVSDAARVERVVLQVTAEKFTALRKALLAAADVAEAMTSGRPQ